MSEPDSAWVRQCGRQLTDAVDGFPGGKRFLLHDRDPLFTAAFRETLAAAGVETVRAREALAAKHHPAGSRGCQILSYLIIYGWRLVLIVREYLTADGRNPFREWLGTHDVAVRARVQARAAI